MKEIWYLKALKKAYARKILEEELIERLKILDNEIFNLFDWDANDKKYSKNDLRKIERLLLKQFIELPDNLIWAMELIESKE